MPDSAVCAADDGVAAGAPLDLETALYNRILSGLRVPGAGGGADVTDDADPPSLAAAVTAAAAPHTCKVNGAVARAVAKSKAKLLMPVRVNYLDGRSLVLKVPRLGYVSDLRAAIAARTEVATATVGLFNDRDEELGDNRRLSDSVDPRDAKVWTLPRDTTRWTCPACFCTNSRSAGACDGCQLQREFKNVVDQNDFDAFHTCAASDDDDDDDDDLNEQLAAIDKLMADAGILHDFYSGIGHDL